MLIDYRGVGVSWYFCVVDGCGEVCLCFGQMGEDWNRDKIGSYIFYLDNLLLTHC